MAKKKNKKKTSKKSAKKALKSTKKVAKKKQSGHAPKAAHVIDLKKAQLKEKASSWFMETRLSFRELKPIFITATIIALVITGFLGIFSKLTHGKSAFNVTVWDLNLSQLTEDQVSSRLETRYQHFLDSPISFKYNQETYNITPKALGFKQGIIDDLVDLVMDTARGSDFWQTQNKLLKSFSNSQNLTPKPDAEIADIEDALRTHIPIIKDPKEAEITYIASIKDFRITDEEDGLAIANFEHILDELFLLGMSLHTKDIDLVLEPSLPDITREHATTALKKVQHYSSRAVKLTYKLREFKLPLIKLQDWFIFEKTIDDEGDYDLLARLNRADVDQFFDEFIKPKIERQAVHPTLTEDEDGNLALEGFGQDGFKINMDETIAKIYELLDQDDFHIPLNLEIEKSTIISKVDKDLGLKTLIGRGESDFSGSPTNRIHNISVGIEKFNNAIIKPDEEFVFGNILGRVDASTGYRKELVIKEGGRDTIPEYGGGICQVSTTAFRAALNTGLPITQRRPHSYNVTYYKPEGLDATVYPPTVELKFLNDTPGHIMIQTAVDIPKRKAYYNFYGTDDGRKVDLATTGAYNWKSIDEPEYEDTEDLPPGETKLKDHGGKKVGFDVKWYRTITKADGEELKDTIFSRYRAFPAYYFRGAELGSWIADLPSEQNSNL